MGPVLDDTKGKNNGDEMQSGSSVTDNQEEIKKGTDELNKSKVKQGVVLLVSDSLLHKLDVKRFFVKGPEDSETGDYKTKTKDLRSKTPNSTMCGLTFAE